MFFIPTLLVSSCVSHVFSVYPTYAPFLCFLSMPPASPLLQRFARSISFLSFTCVSCLLAYQCSFVFIREQQSSFPPSLFLSTNSPRCLSKPQRSPTQSPPLSSLAAQWFSESLSLQRTNHILNSYLRLFHFPCLLLMSVSCFIYCLIERSS